MTTIETCTDEEIAEAMVLANALRAQRDASATWREYVVSGQRAMAADFRQMVENRDSADEGARGAAERLCDLVPKMAAHLASLKAAGAKARDVLGEAHAFITQAAEPESSYGHYHGGDPRMFEPSEDECSAEEIAAHKAACEAWARGDRPDIRRACEPNREPITLTDPETGEQRTVEAGTALALYVPFGIGLNTYPPDEEAVRLRDALAAALVDIEGVVQS
jgi:hypothetical protein